MGKRTMDVERDVLLELKELNDELGLKTTSDVVSMLLDHYKGRSKWAPATRTRVMMALGRERGEKSTSETRCIASSC